MLRPHSLDGALLFFDRGSGDNLRLEGPGLRALRRRAPRVVHWGLSSGCDLRCSFCFRDPSLKGGWDAAEVVDWAQELADAGVLEIAFGQGEPLLFRGFAALVRSLHERTPLGVSFTTNGSRLTPALLDELGEAWGQMRLSYYDDNDPAARVRLLASRGARFGVNLLVTPARLVSLRQIVDGLVDAGCSDLLLLSYNGPDPALHLSPDDDRKLEATLLDLHARHGQALSLKLSVCFGHRLDAVPQLRPVDDDCGAGDEFIAIDSARRLLDCSFHGPGTPVPSAAHALALYRRARGVRSPAGVRGCARSLPLAASRLRRARQAGGREARSLAPREAAGREAAGREAEARVVAWRGWASNHSTAYTLVGEFPSEAKAAGYAAELAQLIERCGQISPGFSERGPSVWQVFGRSDPPPNYDWSLDAGTLSLWRPDVVLSGGRRVLVHRSSTLRRIDVCAQLLLLRHGRILWHLDDEPARARLVFGLDAGEHAGEAALRLRSRGEVQRVGGRVYGWAPFDDAASIVDRLGGVPPVFALADASQETLAQALAQPAPPLAKRRVEWLHLRHLTYAPLRKLLAPLQASPAEVAAEAGITSPFRLPRRWSEVRVATGTVARVDDGPVPGGLQGYLLWRHVQRFQVIEGERLRVRVRFPQGPEQQRPDLRGLSARDLAGLAEPGWSLDEEGAWHLDLVPRDPMAFFSQLHARYQAPYALRIELLPVRPLAAAIRKIQEDLPPLRCRPGPPFGYLGARGGSDGPGSLVPVGGRLVRCVAVDHGVVRPAGLR